MRSLIPTVVVFVCSLLVSGQTSSAPAPTPAAPQAAGSQAKQPAKGQETGKSPAAKPQGAESKEVAPDAAVITIKGLCPTSAPKPATRKTTAGSAATKPTTCETVVTRKQLERLIDTVRPNLPPSQREALAQQYVQLLTAADAATKAGMETDPKVQEQIRIQKLQILAQSYTRDLQQKSAVVPEADIEKYYKDNRSKYEQAKLLRIYIPMVTKEEGKPADEPATKALAEKIQQRAAAGEDFEKLQKEAFADANNKGTPPTVDLGERRRGTLPPKQENPVFSLKAGEVSGALEEGSGFYIYKVVSKDEAPLDKVHDEIKNVLAGERFRENLEKLRTSVQPTYNEQYFKSEAPPVAAGAPAGAPSAPGAAGAPAAPSPQTPSAVPAQPAAPAHPTPPATPEAPKPPPAPSK